MRSHFMGTFLCIAMGVAMTAAGQVPAQVIPAIDLQLRPITQNVGINETARVGLYAVSNSPFNQGFLGVAIVLSWDSSQLRLLGDENPSPSPWSSSGFPFGIADPHSLNETVPPQDGTGLWQAFGLLGSSITATPSGRLLTTFRFKPNVLSSGTVIQVLPEGGIPLITSSGSLIRQNTIVLDFFSPGLNVVGILRPTTLSITQDGGGGTTTPFIVSRNPQSGRVINTVSGISSIVVQFDRVVSTSSIQVTGTNNSVGSGTLLGAGTSTHTLQFAGTLPDEDLYSVAVSADGLFDQWQFKVLLGDCNKDGVVNIFDLGEMRDHLRNGTFSVDCNIQDTDSVINIFDLGHVRTALRNGSSAP